MITYLRQSSSVVLRKFKSLPKFGRGVRALDGLYVEIEHAGSWVGPYGGIARIGEGTGLSENSLC